MNIYKFIANGQEFKIQGPAGATREQAEAIFNQQLSSGSLTGLRAGDIVNAATQAAAGLTSAFSQVTSSVKSTVGSLTSHLPDLKGTPVQDGINSVDFLQKGAASAPIGSLSVTQVKGLVAQAATAVNQAATSITDGKGLGKFGLNATQLERAGLIKPGTSQLISAGASLTATLTSPSVWTGKNGATSLPSVLANENLQNATQQNLMQQSLTQLKQVGAVTDAVSPKQLGSLIQTTTTYGINTATDFIKGKLPGDLVSQVKNTFKQAEYSVNFADANATDLISGVKKAAGFSNTVNRKTLDSATSAIIGNPKIPAPNYNSDVNGFV